MSCCNPNEVITHLTGEAKIYYLDLGEYIKGRTVTGITSVTSDDALLTISSAAIISVDTDDYDQQGNAITIEANTGIRFTMAAGTAGTEYEEYTATVTALVVTSAGIEECRVRVKVQ